jgi:hypothetical protein
MGTQGGLEPKGTGLKTHTLGSSFRQMVPGFLFYLTWSLFRELTSLYTSIANKLVIGKWIMFQETISQHLFLMLGTYAYDQS